VVCADEPTSGLDAFQAERVVRSLKKLCAPGACFPITTFRRLIKAHL
jgi:ABC-type multidrug transport system ATPase subunit